MNGELQKVGMKHSDGQFVIAVTNPLFTQGVVKLIERLGRVAKFRSCALGSLGESSCKISDMVMVSIII